MNKTTTKSKKKFRWQDYLFVITLTYLVLGLFNIMFAWLGLICFIVPLLIAVFGKNKLYCNSVCPRGNLFWFLGTKLKLSRNADIPKWLRSNWFRYGFLIFFMTMFGLMIYNTVLVFIGAADLKQAVTLLWVFKIGWGWADVSWAAPGAAQFAFGFYSVMLTSTLLGLITMILFKPRSWCVYCPMGTMTQGICKLRNRKYNPED